MREDGSRFTNAAKKKALGKAKPRNKVFDILYPPTKSTKTHFRFNPKAKLDNSQVKHKGKR